MHLPLKTESTRRDRRPNRVLACGWLPWAALVTLAAAPPATPPAEIGAKRWNDDQLVSSYRELVAAGGLAAAVRAPSLPKDPLQPRFLDALAWYAAGAPGTAGELTTKRLDGEITEYVQSYLRLIQGKVERGEDNDYARTRTWKLIQKFTVLRNEMSKPERNGRYPYPVLKKDDGSADADSWDRSHTLRSPDEFAEKVCRASHDKPVLVKFGNTNCSECMLFEILGSVRAIAETPEHKGAIDVYKVWWGYQPDSTFTGRIKDPERLNDLVKGEGVSSSPFFMVYRDGRAAPCGDAFPDDHGSDERLESCLRQDLSNAAESKACAPPGGNR